MVDLWRVQALETGRGSTVALMVLKPEVPLHYLPTSSCYPHVCSEKQETLSFLWPLAQPAIL